jgi:DNA-binding MarR family transcriptional regulator
MDVLDLCLPQQGCRQRGLPGSGSREEAGFVRRERDARDRRRVVIRLVLERALSDIAPVFLPMIRALEQTAARYTDDELRLIVEFYGRIEQVFRDHLALLRDASES